MIEEIKETREPPVVKFSDAKTDMMYEMVIVDYEHMTREKTADDWLLGFKADIPGKELQEGYTKTMLEKLFPVKPKKKDSKSPSMLFLNIYTRLASEAKRKPSNLYF